MRAVKQQIRSGVTRWTAAALVGAAAVSGCDSLLEVNLPDAITEDAFDSPATAAVQVNSVMALFECAYSAFTLRAAGYEDNWQRFSGVAGTYSEYDTTPAGGTCDSGAAYSSPWVDPMLVARAQGSQTYDRISGWTDAQVPGRQRLLGMAAMYTALPLAVFGEHFCEMAIDAGPLMTASQTLDLAEEWATRALGHFANVPNDTLTVAQGRITSSMRQMTLGLRSRIRWANGNLEGAVADAAQVPNGFVSYVLREVGEDRRNTVAAFQGGAQQAAGFLQGPVVIRSGNIPYGITTLGNNPVTGEPWPSPVPFTGYLNLAIDQATGRAITDAGYPLTTATAGTVRDTRVLHRTGNTAGGPNNIVNKYTTFADDIPLINWLEMRLIEAQYRNQVLNDQAGAIALVNQVRNAASLPIVQGAYAAGATQESVRRMIIEERRRALWLEGRFWSTKIQNTDLLWFPRNNGSWTNQSAVYVLGGGVRLLLPNNEYQINPNLSLESRGTGCAPAQRPVFN